MNLKYIRNNILFAFGTLLVSILPSLFLLFEFNLIDNIVQIIVFVWPIMIGLGIIYKYSFLYSEKRNSIISQMPLNEYVKILAPVLSFIIVAILVDVGMMLFYDPSTISSGLFVQAHVKYFIISLGFLFLVSSRNIIKLTVIVLVSMFIVFAQPHHIYHFIYIDGRTFIELLTVIYISASAIILAVYLHFNWLRKHNSVLLNIVYYFELFMLIFIFFRAIFITRYPYNLALSSIDIGDYSIAIAPFIVVILIVIVITFFQDNKLNIKRIGIYLLPIVIVTTSYVVITNINESNKSCANELEKITCNYLVKKIENPFENLKVRIYDMDIELRAGGYDLSKMNEYLSKRIVSCYNSQSVTQLYSLNSFFGTEGALNYEKMKDNNHIDLYVDEQLFLIDTKEFILTDFINTFEDEELFIVLTLHNTMDENGSIIWMDYPEVSQQNIIYFNDATSVETKKKFLVDFDEGQEITFVDTVKKKETLDNVLKDAYFYISPWELSYQSLYHGDFEVTMSVHQNGRNSYGVPINLSNKEFEQLKKKLKESGE